MDWTEKYRPQTLDGVLGNPTSVNTLRAWARSWENGIPEMRAVVISGPPGIGKTTSALALAHEMGWSVVEMNASDQRRMQDVQDIAVRGSLFNTFSDEGEYLDASKGQMKLIILDEADSLSGNNDRGGSSAINDLIKNTRQPVILIANDLYALKKKCSAVDRHTLQITFKKPQASTMSKNLYRIAEAEGVDVDPAAMEAIVSNAKGDMRAAVRDLESLALGESEVTAEMAEGLSGREDRKDLYNFVSAVFRGRNPMEARRVLAQADTDPDSAELWIEENLPTEYIDRGDLVRGYEKLSRADIYLSRTRHLQYYGLWKYAGDMLSAGVASARMTDKYSHGRINFPSYLSKMSRSRGVRGTRASIVAKLSEGLHTSTRKAEMEVLPYLRIMASKDPALWRSLAEDYGIDADEMAFLIGKKADSKDIKTLYSELDDEREQRRIESSRPRAREPSQEPPPSEPPEEPTAEPPKAEPVQEAASKPRVERPKGQRSLFDF